MATVTEKQLREFLKEYGDTDAGETVKRQMGWDNESLLEPEPKSPTKKGKKTNVVAAAKQPEQPSLLKLFMLVFSIVLLFKEPILGVILIVMAGILTKRKRG